MATLTETFTNIADAIRSKTETTDKITPENMPSMIEGITTGGNVMELSITSNGTYRAPEGIDGYTPVIVNVPQDGSPPAEAFVISGVCNYRFAYGGWDWFLNQYGNQITTDKINDAQYMFFMGGDGDDFPLNINLGIGTNNSCNCKYMFSQTTFKGITEENVAGMAGLIGDGTSMFGFTSFEKIPSLIFNNTTYYDYDGLYNGSYMKEIGDIVNLYPNNIGGMFSSCNNLKKLPNFINPNFDRINSYKYSKVNGILQSCKSLRSIPEEFMNTLALIQKPTNIFYPSYCLTNNLFSYCHTLDEIVDLPLGITDDAEITSNMFISTFNECFRLKRLMFRTNEDGTPKILSLKNQAIDLAHIGYGVYPSQITGYNSGCSDADRVYWNADEFNNERHDNYLEQKDNPNYWTISEEYSRYNKTSAIETINSLPDTSAYLATVGGTNTIKFEGDAGSSTDGGAINTMTEEEIAVATAKGWTVSFV